MWNKERTEVYLGGRKVISEKGIEGDSVGGRWIRIKYWQMYENAILKPIILYANLKI